MLVLKFSERSYNKCTTQYTYLVCLSANAKNRSREGSSRRLLRMLYKYKIVVGVFCFVVSSRECEKKSYLLYKATSTFALCLFVPSTGSIDTSSTVHHRRQISEKILRVRLRLLDVFPIRSSAVLWQVYYLSL